MSELPGPGKNERALGIEWVPIVPFFVETPRWPLRQPNAPREAEQNP